MKVKNIVIIEEIKKLSMDLLRCSIAARINSKMFIALMDDIVAIQQSGKKLNNKEREKVLNINQKYADELSAALLEIQLRK